MLMPPPSGSGCVAKGGDGNGEPAGEEGEAAEGGNDPEGAHAGEDEEVETAGEEDDPDQEAAAGPDERRPPLLPEQQGDVGRVAAMLGHGEEFESTGMKAGRAKLVYSSRRGRRSKW